MTRFLSRLTLTAGFLLMVGVAPSAADTITFDNGSLPSESGFSFSMCGPGTRFNCIELMPDTFTKIVITTAPDDAFPGIGTIDPAGVTSLFLPNTTPLPGAVSPVEVSVVPEPGSLLLLGSSLLLFARVVRGRVK